MNLIFHITSKSEWEKGKKDGQYYAKSLKEDGFIHSSKINQVVSVANYLFKGKRDLVILVINENKIKSEIKYEKNGKQIYPHIFGPLNLNAVIKVVDFPCEKDGTFNLPDDLNH